LLTNPDQKTADASGWSWHQRCMLHSTSSYLQ